MKSKSPSDKGAREKCMTEQEPMVENDMEHVSSGLLEQMSGVDDDDLDHLAISLWTTNHADLVKRVARQELMITQLDEDIDKAKEEMVIWQQKARDLEMVNAWLTDELKTAKSFEEERALRDWTTSCLRKC